MEKSISLILGEAKQSIADVINNTGLPPVLLEPIIKDFYMEIQNAAVLQYQKEKQEYESSLKQQEKQEESVEE